MSFPFLCLRYAYHLLCLSGARELNFPNNELIQADGSNNWLSLSVWLTAISSIPDGIVTICIRDTHMCTCAIKSIDQDFFFLYKLKHGKYSESNVFCAEVTKKSLLLWQDIGLIRKWCCLITGYHNATSGMGERLYIIYLVRRRVTNHFTPPQKPQSISHQGFSKSLLYTELSSGSSLRDLSQARGRIFWP